jgi:hypothetical protein
MYSFFFFLTNIALEINKRTIQPSRGKENRRWGAKPLQVVGGGEEGKKVEMQSE